MGYPYRRVMIYEAEFGLSSTDCQVQWDNRHRTSSLAAVGRKQMMKIVLDPPSTDPDWPPQGSAYARHEGHLQFSSVGQLWEVKDRCWKRVREPTQEQLIALLAERFVGWPLPKSVCSDLCASDPNYAFPRSGTNLLSVEEARQMVTYLFGT